MTPYYSDDWLTILQGDVREVLPILPADSVDCIVTSPPYWGLRDYGTDGQIGLERTPEEYVANLVGIFRELRRVLKATGTAWCNLGDSFLPGKQLAGIPWRVAFALQADGWYLRSDIIWSKPNPMPESVTDRPTKAHEYLFLLTKSARYYFDADAVREVGSVDSHGGGVVGVGQKKAYTGNGHSGLHAAEPAGAAGRNLRSVWTIATRPYPGAHFAVFPPELPERCIKAGSSERGVCPECGAPWERVVERRESLARTTGDGWQEGRSEQIASGRRGRSRPGSFTSVPVQPPYVPPSEIDRYGTGEAGVHRKVGGQYQKWLDANPPQTLGWRPSCAHEPLKPIPAVVLDPFAGSGTTGMVANRLSRRAILIDLNGDYLKQQLQRNAQTPLGLGAA